MTDESTENFEPVIDVSVDLGIELDSHHRAFSSSVSAKNVISSSSGKTRRKDLSTPYIPSSSYRLRDVRPEAGLMGLGSWLSSTAIAFLRLMVAVTFFVTSLNATKLAPITRSRLRRQDCKTKD